MPSQNEQDRELIDAIDRLERRISDSAEATERSADKITSATEATTRTVKAATDLGEASFQAGKTGLKLGGAGAILYGAHKTGTLGTMARSAAGAAGFGFGGAAGGAAAGSTTMLGRAARLLPWVRLATAGLMLGAAVKAITGGGRGHGVQAGVIQESEKQTALLAELLKQSRRTNESIEVVYGRARSAIDPFGRDPAFFRNRRARAGFGLASLASVGLTPSEESANRAGRVRSAQFDTQEVRGALGRSVSDALTTTKIVLEKAKQAGYAALTLQSYITRAGSPLNEALNQYFGRGVTLPEGRGGPLGGLTEQRFVRLGAQGPGNVVSPVATGSQGTLGDYRLKVQIQREELQRNITRTWQDEMLQTMKELVELGKLDIDRLYEKEIEYGRKPGSV